MKQSKAKPVLPFLCFMVMFCTMLGISVYLFLSSGLPNGVSGLTSDKIEDIGFFDEDNKSVPDMSRLYEIGDTGRVSFVVPDNLPPGSAFCFRTLHARVDIRLDTGESLYTTICAESPLYTDSPGVYRIQVPLHDDYSGHRVNINYDLAYGTSKAGLDEICIMRPDGFILSIIDDMLMPMFMCCSYIAIGCMLILIGFISLRVSKGDYSMFWLGVLAISVALYCLSESQFLQIFAADNRLVHLFAMFSMSLMPLPAVAYIDTLFDMRPRWLASAFCCVSLAWFLCLTIMNYTGTCDYHDCLPISQGFIISSILVLAFGITSYIVQHIKRDKKVSVYTLAMSIGVGAIMIAGVIDVIRYWNGNTTDIVSTVRIGFLVFLLCFSFASSERIISAFQAKARTKLIAKLAYEDGLTGLLNRTSYQEMRDKIDAEHIRSGIVMMDLNNLKYVNDNLGHDDGDAMLLAAANLIRTTFSKISGASCYRIGGDEFVVVIQNEHIKKSCEDGIRDLRSGYTKFNAETEEHFKLVIAAGYSIYDFDADHDKSFKDAADIADGLMYEDKRRLKQMRYVNIMV